MNTIDRIYNDDDDPREPTDLELAVVDRMSLRLCPFGPLTRDEHDSEASYAAYCAEREAEYEAEQRAGGRTICPDCGKRTVTHRAVVTLGYAAHPDAEYSGLAECEACGYNDLAG